MSTVQAPSKTIVPARNSGTHAARSRSPRNPRLKKQTQVSTKSTTKAKSSSSKKKPTVSATPKSTTSAPKRLDSHEVIMSVLKANGGALKLDLVEAEGQKVKKISANHYRVIAKRDFVIKDELVQAEISAKGAANLVKYASRRGIPHWFVRTYPDVAKKVAGELKLTLPSISFLEDPVVPTIHTECPIDDPRGHIYLEAPQS